MATRPPSAPHREVDKADSVNIIDGTAAFEDGTPRGSSTAARDGMGTVEFGRAIVATGSRPVEISSFDFASDELIVVGAAYTATGLSTLFAKIGTDVTVVATVRPRR